MRGTETTAVELSLAGRLSLSRPHLSKDLIDDEAFDRLLRAARLLPGDVMAAIEVRLAAGSGRVDLSARLVEPRQAKDLSLHLAESPDSLRSFLSTWSRVSPPDPAHALHSLWIELDLARDRASPLPDPVVCARLRRSADLDWVAKELLPRMHGRPLSATQNRLLRTAWKAIPPSCRPLYVFSLRARGQQSVRLEMYTEDWEVASTWLHRANHPNASALLRTASTGIERVDRLHLSCDIGPDGWSPRIGLEGSFHHQPHREMGWREWIGQLEEQRLCDPNKGAALESWVGTQKVETGSLVRALSHLKLIVHGQRGLDAKGYLIFQHLS